MVSASELVNDLRNVRKSANRTKYFVSALRYHTLREELYITLFITSVSMNVFCFLVLSAFNGIIFIDRLANVIS